MTARPRWLGAGVHPFVWPPSKNEIHPMAATGSSIEGEAQPWTDFCDGDQ
jgi:hypothetical protein